MSYHEYFQSDMDNLNEINTSMAVLIILSSAWLKMLKELYIKKIYANMI